MKNFKPIKIRNYTISKPIILAPLCGITDSPFRRVCKDMGAGLTFIEMISATAVKYNSEKTFRMMKKHPDEINTGIQLTATDSDVLAYSVDIINKMNFKIIDINMGCPAKKVVKNGGGSAILQHPEKVYEYVKTARKNTDKPLSVKIRAGWDRNSINHKETSKAIEEGGADMITIHGRTKADTYSVKNNLQWIKEVKQNVSIPVIGNGDLFSIKDVIEMKKQTNIDGVMISRGVLGNPFIFKTLTMELNKDYSPSLVEWKNTILTHIKYFKEFYDNIPQTVVTMRKHLLWYCKGWKNIKKLKSQINTITDIDNASEIITEFVDNYDRDS